MLEKENSHLELGFVRTKQAKINLKLWARVVNNEKCKRSMTAGADRLDDKWVIPMPFDL